MIKLHKQKTTKTSQKQHMDAGQLCYHCSDREFPAWNYAEVVWQYPLLRRQKSITGVLMII